jgi:hypothetical protein
LAAKGVVRVRLEQSLRLNYINRSAASYEQVAVNSGEICLEDEIEFLEEEQEIKFHTFEPPTMTRYLPVENEE